MIEESCCFCKNNYGVHELTQDRLDVDVFHYCEIDDERLYEDEGKKGCDNFELHNELKNTVEYKMCKINKLLQNIKKVLLRVIE